MRTYGSPVGGGALPRTRVVFYKEESGNAPVLDWLDSLPPKIQDKCVLRIERLRELGHELRRPEADLLRNGIHELRIGRQGMNYRILYFFYGQTAAVLAHGLVKEREVPSKDIELALQRKGLFEKGLAAHTYREE
jgi:phage-related protein